MDEKAKKFTFSLKVKQVVEEYKSEFYGVFYKIEWESTWVNEDVLTLLPFVKNRISRRSCKKNTYQDVDSSNSGNFPPRDEQNTDQNVFKVSVNEKLHKIFDKSEVTANHVGFYSCSFCDFKFANEKFLQEHEKKDHLENPSNVLHVSLQQSSKCKNCDTTFSNPAQYEEHLKRHTDDNTADGQVLNEDNGNNLRCKVCDRKFSTQEILDRHLTLHNRTFKSKKNLHQKCSASCERSQRLYLLKRSTRLKLAKIRNQADNKTNNTNPPVKNGIAKSHNNTPGEIPVIEEQSDNTTTTTTPPTKLSFPYFVIPESASMVKVPKPEEMQDRCLMEMPRQKRKVGEDIPPRALMAAKQYIKQVMYRRKQEHFLKGGKEASKDENAVPVMSVINGRAAYGCKVCRKLFFNKFHHREHYNVHSGEMPYDCEFCNKRFRQRSGWNRHIKLHHKYRIFDGPIPCNQNMAPPDDAPFNLPGSSLNEPYTNLVDQENVEKSSKNAANNLSPRNTNKKAFNSMTPITLTTNTAGSVEFVKNPSQPLAKPLVIIRPPTMVQTTSVLMQQPPIQQAATTPEKAKFQFQRITAMNGKHITLIRYLGHLDGTDSSKHDFAYVLGDDGCIKSRIFLDDYPLGQWIDFKLDEAATEVMMDRVHRCDTLHRRGPKPSFLNKSSLSINVDSALQCSETTDPSLPVLSPDKADSAVEANSPKTQGRTFRSGKEKRFKCTVCNQKFLSMAHLNDHTLIHTGEMPFKCMFCSRPFRHKSGLASHHKRHIEKGIYDRPIRSSNKYTIDQLREEEPAINIHADHVPAAPALAPTNKRKMNQPKHYTKQLRLSSSDHFECRMCSVVFPIRTAYVEHINNVHCGIENTTVVDNDNLEKIALLVNDQRSPLNAVSQAYENNAKNTLENGNETHNNDEDVKPDVTTLEALLMNSANNLPLQKSPKREEEFSTDNDFETPVIETSSFFEEVSIKQEVED